MAYSDPEMSEREKRLISRGTKREEEERRMLLEQEALNRQKQRDEYLRQLRESKLERHTNVLPIDLQSLKQPPSFSPLRGGENSIR